MGNIALPVSCGFTAFGRLGDTRTPVQGGQAFGSRSEPTRTDFSVDAPDRAWVTDINYLRTFEGWLYLAVVVDLYSRIVVDW